ncbi:MAG: hypothetical protein ACLR06_15290 [Christensenellaceae bacterium]
MKDYKNLSPQFIGSYKDSTANVSDEMATGTYGKPAAPAYREDEAAEEELPVSEAAGRRPRKRPWAISSRKNLQISFYTARVFRARFTFPHCFLDIYAGECYNFL